MNPIKPNKKINWETIEPEKDKPLYEKVKDFDKLGFELEQCNIKFMVFFKEDVEYSYHISLNVFKQAIAFYKIKNLTSTNWDELQKELNQPHHAEVWLAPKEVIELSLKLWDFATQYTKRQLRLFYPNKTYEQFIEEGKTDEN